MTHDSEPIGDFRDHFVRPGRYPGLRQEESQLLRAYLLDVGTDGIQRVRTQVEVGPGENVPQLESQYREMAFRLSRWKIDCIIDYKGTTEIIELKSRANHTALGQLVGYGYYLGQHDLERSNPRLKVVAYRETPAVRKVARAIGAEIHLVPHADPTSASRRHEVVESLGELRGDTA